MNADIAPVMEEIKAVLKKHDMMGIVIVANPTHLDYTMVINASWSCAHMVQHPDGGVEVRLRSKREHFPSLEAQKACLDATVGTFVSAIDAMRGITEDYQKLLLCISKHFQIDGKSTREPDGEAPGQLPGG